MSARQRGSGSLGVAIGRDRIVVAGAWPSSEIDGPSGPTVWPLPQGDGDEGIEAVLLRVLSEVVARAVPVHSIAVALLPDLSEMRRVSLPPLSDSDLEERLKRRGKRYLPFPWDDVLAAPAAREVGTSDRWIAFGPAPVIEAVHRAAAEVGIRVLRIAPAVVAWRAHLEELASETPSGEAVLIVEAADPLGGSVVHVLKEDAKRGTEYRRFPTNDAGVRTLAGWLAPDARVHVVASDDAATALARALGDREVSREATSLDGAALAALRIAEESGEWLVPAGIRRLERSRERRGVAATLAASVLLIAGAAALHVFGLHRELEAVRAEREALRTVVTQALDVEARVSRVAGALDELEGKAALAPRWSSTIADVGLALPESAHLAALRGAADSLVVEAVAGDAAVAFRALEGLPTLTALQAVSPVRREILEDQTSIERLTLTARVVSASARARAGEAVASARGGGAP